MLNVIHKIYTVCVLDFESLIVKSFCSFRIRILNLISCIQYCIENVLILFIDYKIKISKNILSYYPYIYCNIIVNL